ncbi:D-inositol-3-phosphate glycosyltransferase [bioreactor metagenome]|uniref:D-inositol-3-phosphate glycosyltransferase n=1 Tax=bioreactor metagenome TaxID=1076179 RepID=A0A645J0B9_9ZZZZ
MREGLGIAALEAMASGLPLITSNIQGIKDFVTDGKTGYCFAPSDVDGFASAIDKLTKDKILREKIGSYNKLAVQKYDLKNSLAAVASIIQSMMEA